MEIRGGYDNIISVIPTADVVEGRMGLLTTHSHSYDFGSKEDRPGFKVPATAEEAKRAKFMIAWGEDNRETPIISPIPSTVFNTRNGYGSTANAPITSATVYLTQPGHQEGLTIPSGTYSLAYFAGTYTVESGSYIYNAALENVGAPVIVANTAEDTTDAGKLKYQATMDERVVGLVIDFNSSTSALTVQLLG